MRRTACGDIDIAGELRHFSHQPDEAAVAASGKARLALILDRPAHFVAARQAVDIGAVFGQPCQEVCEIFQLLGDHMDDARFFLYAADDRHIACA